MGYLVHILIDVPGRQFNAIQDAKYQANEKKLAEFSQSGSLWDGKLADSSLEYLVELSGTLTIVALTIKASTYKWVPEARKQVEQWETVLHSLLPSIRTLRVDELILEEWESVSGELWFREDGAFDRAWHWFHDSSQPEQRTLEIPPGQ